LKITKDALNIIEKDYGHDSSTCRRKMFSKWLTSNTDASYADLVGALVVINKKDVAENVSQKFCKYLYHLSNYLSRCGHFNHSTYIYVHVMLIHVCTLGLCD